MASQDHRESVARTVAVLRAVQDETDDEWATGRLDDAAGVCQDYLLEAHAPTPTIPDEIAIDAPTVRNATISIDRVQSGVGRDEREVLSDAMGILDEYQEVLDE